MGCVVSKQDEETDDVVSLCRERKRLLKLVLEHRYAFAEAQCKYNQSLHAMAVAIKLFVARHSSASSPFLISFPETSDSVVAVTHQICLQQKPSKPTHEIFACPDSDSSPALHVKRELETHDKEDECEDKEGEVCEHFYGDGDALLPSEQRELGWDFFSPFDGVENAKSAKVVHEEKSVEERKSLGVIETHTKGRELLEALKDVEDYLVKAYNSGLDVSRMLEVNRVHLQSNLEEIKDSSTKVIRSITWNRSLSSRSPSCKSLLKSASSSSIAWTEEKNDLFDAYGGMQSGQHSLTLERLYAWEKKLYEEVKAGDKARINYEKKILQLKKQNAKPDSHLAVNETASEVRDFYTSMLVSVRGVESMSERIQMLRDKELQPELVELLHGLMRNWKLMLESHEIQSRIMSEVKHFNCPAYGKFCNDSHRLATLQLEAEIQNWCACFATYVSTQKAYVKALSSWLSKFIAPEVQISSMGKSKFPPPSFGSNKPLLLVLCKNWSHRLDRLPDNEVKKTMKRFAKDIQALWVQEGVEQQKKRKVAALSKELDKKVLAFQRSESKVLEGNTYYAQESELDVRRRVKYLTEQNSALDEFRKRLEVEKAEHRDQMLETQQATVYCFQREFPLVFQSLAELSQGCVKMYADLVTYSVDEKFCK